MPTNLLKRAYLLVAVVAPGVALSAQPAPSAQSLGTSETILQHCARINLAAAGQDRAQGKLLTQGARDVTLAKVRPRDEYQQARDSTLAYLAKVDDGNGKKVCTQSLAQGK